jgi:hypothetical protein
VCSSDLQAFQPLVLRVTDGSAAANPVAAATVMFQTTLERIPPNPSPVGGGDNGGGGGTPQPVILGTSTAQVATTQDGLASLTPGTGSLSAPLDVMIAATVGNNAAQFHLQMVPPMSGGTQKNQPAAAQRTQQRTLYLRLPPPSPDAPLGLFAMPEFFWGGPSPDELSSHDQTDDAASLELAAEEKTSANRPSGDRPSGDRTLSNRTSSDGTSSDRELDARKSAARSSNARSLTDRSSHAPPSGGRTRVDRASSESTAGFCPEAHRQIDFHDVGGEPSASAAQHRAGECKGSSPGGANDISPPLQRWDKWQERAKSRRDDRVLTQTLQRREQRKQVASPGGTAEGLPREATPNGKNVETPPPRQQLLDDKRSCRFAQENAEAF